MLWYDSRAMRRLAPPLPPMPLRDAVLPDPLPPVALDRLRRFCTGKVLIPGDPDYDSERRLANPKFNYFPQVIVLCLNESDVAVCLSVARDFDIRPIPRSGGHSTAGFSSGDGILIDLSGLNTVTVDGASLRATCGVGADFRAVNAALEAQDVHMAGGACPDVCIGGYLQGGGYGFTARLYGMHCDQAISLRVMLASGRIIEVNEVTDPDLFWAMRGGTGNTFGILLSATYRLQRGCYFTGFSIRWPLRDPNGGHDLAGGAMAWLQSKMMRTSGASDQIGYQLIWVFEGETETDREPWLLMRGMSRLPTLALLDLLAPVLNVPGAELQALYGPTEYSVLNRLLLSSPYEVPQFPPDMTPMPPPESKLSRYLDQPISAQDWASLIAFYCTSPSPYTIAAFEVYGAAIARPPVPNAFIHRNVDCDVFFDVFWTDPQQQQVMQAYLSQWEALIAPHWSGQVYQNYPAQGDPDYAAQYWADAYPRLQKIKAAYDPNNLFRFQQGIVPAGATDG